MHQSRKFYQDWQFESLELGREIVNHLQNFDLGMSGPPYVGVEYKVVCVFPVLTVFRY